MRHHSVNSILYVAVGALGLAALSNCDVFRLQTDHCMARGGDAACGGSFCTPGNLDIELDGMLECDLGDLAAKNGCVEDAGAFEDMTQCYFPCGLSTAAAACINENSTNKEQIESCLKELYDSDGLRPNDESTCDDGTTTTPDSSCEPECMGTDAPFCDEANSTCVADCSVVGDGMSDADEACDGLGLDTPFCAGGACVPCIDGVEPSTCAENEVCDMNQCVPLCSDASDCNDQLPVCGPEGLCVECDEANTSACSASAPFCDVESNTCISCGGFPTNADADAACAAVDADRPLCVEDSCVACSAANTTLCDNQQLVCVEGNCVACTAHEQCMSGACHLVDDDLEDPFAGECFAIGDEITVQGSDLAQALTDAAPEVPGFIILAELPASASYLSLPIIDAGKIIAIIAAPGENPSIGNNQGNPSLQVQGADTVLYMDGLRVASSSAQGLVADEALVWVDRSHIVQNDGDGILAQNNANLILRNSFVGFNGLQFADTRGITATDATLTLLYDTVAANSGTADSGPLSISCDAATSGSVRNSIVATGDDTISCPGLEFNDNIVDTDNLSGANNTVLSFDPRWFPNIAMADLHIAMGPPFDGIAQWQDGDPTTDIDGDPRPTMDGAADYAGADVP